ncbi:MAG: hypothetical protein KAJ93_04995 [Methanosarcinales archaeon]|nr:hypothetical protein [Methanosarcinales archaeon]
MVIKSTKKQRDEIRKCHGGVGFMLYHIGNGETVELEFYINRKTRQPCYITNGQPLEFEIIEDE